MPTILLSRHHVTWINITQPNSEDIHQLAENYPQFHPLNLQDCLTELEFPKLDHHDQYVFLIMQFPFWDARERISRPAEIDIFVASGILVTSHRGELQPLNEFFAKTQGDEAFREQVMAQGASPLLYHLLNELVNYCFPIVKKVHQHLDRVENSMFHAEPRSLLNDMAVLRRDIISLRSILRPQMSVVGALIHGNWPFIHEDLDAYWGDINDHLLQLCSLLDEYSEVVSGLSDTIDTIASHRIDEVVRLLTVVTVLTLPLTLLATIFGMNVVMPLADHPILFYFLISIGAVLTVWLLWYLRNKKWLWSKKAISVAPFAEMAFFDNNQMAVTVDCRLYL